MKKIIYLLIWVCILITPTAYLYSQDWPQFRGPGRDSRVQGFTAPASWPAELKLQWRVTVGTGDASPVLSGKHIFLHTRQGVEETVLCLDASFGTEVWKYSYRAPAVTGPASSHPGPRSTPAISDGKIVTFGVSGILSCFDLSSGKLLWKKDNSSQAVPQFFTGMSPIIHNGMVIIHQGEKDNGLIVACDLNTGTEKWKYSGEGPCYASPSLMNINNTVQLIMFTEKTLIALNPDNGNIQWKIETPPQQRFYISVSPVIDGNKIYYTGLGYGTKAVEVTSQNNKFIINELWNNTEIGAKWTTPILRNGFLYGFSDQRKMYCINASNGRTAWVDNTPSSDFSTIIDCGPVIIGLPGTGNLIVIKPDPTRLSEIIRYKVTGTPVYSFPVIAGNRIYVKDSDSLVLYSIN